MALGWHRGELAMHALVGVPQDYSDAMVGNIRPAMTNQHATFYPMLPFCVIGTVDEEENVWATILDSPSPGFLIPLSATQLEVNAMPSPGDPARAGLERRDRSANVGLLGIQLETRRRNRLNGTIKKRTDRGFVLGVDQSFGNCPQYIHTRKLARAKDASPAVAPRVGPGEGATADGYERLENGVLDAAAREFIGRCVTLFVATYMDEGDSRFVDVSHRGGRAGFVSVSENGNVITVPDFHGNRFFNTLGNMLINPKAGVIFADFESGDILQVTGEARIITDIAEVPRLAQFQGAERFWQVDVKKAVRRKAALRWRGAVDERSPETLPTGTWAEARDRGARGWRRLQCVGVQEESADVRSFELAPIGDDDFVPAKPGEHLVLRVPGDEAPGSSSASPQASARVRSYTISRAMPETMPARDGTNSDPNNEEGTRRSYRISVKRDGAASAWLHDALSAGGEIEARGPQGEFHLVVDEAAEGGAATSGGSKSGRRRGLVFLSAGIGITPMLAMAAHVIDADLSTALKGGPPQRPLVFLHGVRDETTAPFTTELEALLKRANGHVPPGADPVLRVTRVYSRWRGAAPPVAPNEAGRISLETVLKHVPGLADPSNDAWDVYLCGPPEFTQSLYNGLRDSCQVRDARIHAEAFGPASLVRRLDADAAAAAAARVVELRPAAKRQLMVGFSRSQKAATWRPPRGGEPAMTLLELAEAVGLTPEFGCRSGTCGTCRTKIVCGEVAYPRHTVAPAAASRDAALICCAVPADPRDPRVMLELEI